MRKSFYFSASLLVFSMSHPCFGQQANIGIGNHRSGLSFQERLGGVELGPRNPGSTMGLGVGFGGVQARLRMFGEQRSSLSMSSSRPSIALSHGIQGWFFDGWQQPFVTSLTPVVSNGPSPIQSLLATYDRDWILQQAQKNRWLREKRIADNSKQSRFGRDHRNSSAARPDISVAEIKSQARRTSQKSKMTHSSTGILILKEISKRKSR